jgi:hypothetical protein
MSGLKYHAIICSSLIELLYSIVKIKATFPNIKVALFRGMCYSSARYPLSLHLLSKTVKYKIVQLQFYRPQYTGLNLGLTHRRTQIEGI